MSDSKYTELARRVGEAAIETRGVTEQKSREAARDFAQALVEGRFNTSPDSPAVSKFVRAMVKEPRAADVAVLQTDGLDDDGIMEIAISAAVGIGRARLVNGLRALKESRS